MSGRSRGVLRQPYALGIDAQVSTAILSAALGGLAGAAVSGGLTWWVARGQREHEREQAREARRQSRYERTYVDILEHLFLVMDFVDRTLPMLSTDNDPKPPEFPDDAHMRRLNARASVFASSAIRDELRVLSDAARLFQAAAWRVELERKYPDRAVPTGSLDAWQDLEEKRIAVRNVHNRIVEIANAELDARGAPGRERT